MGDVVAVNLDPSDEQPQRRRSRTMWEIMHPDDVRTGWRELPGLIGSSLRLVWEAGRRTFLLVAVLQLITAVAAGLQLFATQYALNSILQAGESESFTDVVPAIAILVGITVVMEAATSVQNEQSRVLGELVARKAYDRVLDVSTKIDLIAYESPDFYDRLRRANMQGQFRSLQTVQSLLGLVGGAIAAVGIIIALTSIQPWLLPIVLLGYVPLWIVSRSNTRDSYRFAFGMTPNDRQRNYLQNVLLGRDSAKEVRAFNLGPFLRERYDRLYDLRVQELRSLARRRTSRSLAGSLTSSAVAACAAAALAYLYTTGHMSLASTGAAVFGLYQLRGRLQAMHFSVAGLYEATLFIRDYTSFLELEPRLEPSGRTAPTSFERLEVDEVTFVYPDADRPALDRVSLEIGSGEIVALVGENGSGKTTLAKLVAGLYRPERGSVRWDGVDTAELDPDELRASVAVIFQDFARFLLPAHENVALGRHERIADRDGVVAAAQRAGAHDFLNDLPEGYETMLGREFHGGWDLSIGQWQRVALARAFFRDAPFVILDEPTAALDARAESDLFDRMRELLAGRAVLLISHRFSSVRSADRIYVLRHGQVVEHGRHEQLMALGGLYAELFTLQARQYVDVDPIPSRPPPGTRLLGAGAAWDRRAGGAEPLGEPGGIFTIRSATGEHFPGSLDGEGGGNAAPP